MPGRVALVTDHQRGERQVRDGVVVGKGREARERRVEHGGLLADDGGHLRDQVTAPGASGGDGAGPGPPGDLAERLGPQEVVPVGVGREPGDHAPTPGRDVGGECVQVVRGGPRIDHEGVTRADHQRGGGRVERGPGHEHPVCDLCEDAGGRSAGGGHTGRWDATVTGP